MINKDQEMYSITEQQAIDKYNTEWWKTATSREIVRFQLFTNRLCCPFDKFHAAVEKVLNRPVWTHKFGLNYDGLCREFLGERDPPSFEEIINMLSKDKDKIIIIANQ